MSLTMRGTFARAEFSERLGFMCFDFAEAMFDCEFAHQRTHARQCVRQRSVGIEDDQLILHPAPSQGRRAAQSSQGR